MKNDFCRIYVLHCLLSKICIFRFNRSRGFSDDFNKIDADDADVDPCKMVNFDL